MKRQYNDEPIGNKTEKIENPVDSMGFDMMRTNDFDYRQLSSRDWYSDSNESNRFKRTRCRD